MNILATAMLTSAIAATPGTALLSNPFDGLSVSAAGIVVDFSADGIEAGAADTTDFEIEIRTKSGTPVRVRL